MSESTETLDDLLLVLVAEETLEDFCARAGVDPKALRYLRMGQIKTPHRATIAKLAKALEIPAQRVKQAIQESRRVSQ